MRLTTVGRTLFPPAEADLIPGRIRINRAGKGFLQPDDATINEVAIPESATLTALDQDRVLVRRDRPESRNTGTIIRVLERHRTKIVGTLQKSSRFLFVIPDDPRIPHDIYVPEPRDVGRRARVGAQIDDRCDHDPGGFERGGRVVGIVIVGEQHRAAARRDRVTVDVGLDRARQHGSRPIVAGKDQRPLDRAARQHDPARADMP